MAFDLLSVLQQIPLTTLVPSWFYLFSGMVYLLVAAISFFVSYFSFRLFNTTSSKLHSALALSFFLIGIAFVILTFSSIYTWENSDSLNTAIFNLNSSAFNSYYFLSIFAYLILVLINLPKSEKQMYAFVPLWFISSLQFHLVSLMFLLYISARTVLNFFKIKSNDAFLVMLAFLMITLFHIFLVLLPFGIELYLVAHGFLIVGFLSLLAMLIRVTRK